MKDGEVRDKHGLSAEVWRNSTKDKALVQAVRAERNRRCSTAPPQERQQPDTLSKRRQFSTRS